MLKVKLWFRISEKGRDCIREHQKIHQPGWMPPDDKMSKSVPAVSVAYASVDFADPENTLIVKVMQATPAEVKHGQGAFGEGKS
jgi:tryptophanyl-tRNA synthetase